MNNNGKTTEAADDFIKNFPFQNMRKRQRDILNEIAVAFASGYKYILLEAPTGFGKSAVAVTAALRLRTCYLCTATKDLQAQYKGDFSYLKVLKGKNNFPCAVKEDFIRNGTYRCGLCVSNSANECRHTRADYGPCISNKDFKGPGCKYRTLLKDYEVINRGTREEEVFIDKYTMDHYKKEFSQWLHIKNLKDQQTSWHPCEYFDQLNIASASGHSILNYPVFLDFYQVKRSFLLENC